MKWLIDETLAESVVFLCADGGRKEIAPGEMRRYHREREQVYALKDPDERDRAFSRLHLRWFQELKFEEWLERIAAGFPRLESGLSALAIRKARARSEEEAELYVNAEKQRHGVIALRPERFLDDRALLSLLHHEFTHLSDMVDPAFGYAPDLGGEKTGPAVLIATRERYRLLWDITIDGRLVGCGRLALRDKQQRRSAFFNMFQFLSPGELEQIFECLWNDPAPRHQRLAELASNPRGLQEHTGPMPGGLCPLCNFPNFEWASAELLMGEIQGLVQSEFPDWSPDQGICQRCFEIYTCNRIGARPSCRFGTGESGRFPKNPTGGGKEDSAAA